VLTSLFVLTSLVNMMLTAFDDDDDDDYNDDDDRVDDDVIIVTLVRVETIVCCFHSMCAAGVQQCRRV